MGGSDNKENLIEVTVEKHAMFHYCNWKLWGKEEDRIAWKTLTGQMTLSEAKYEAIKLGARKTGQVMKDKMKDQETKEEWSNMIKGFWEREEYRKKQIPRLLELQKHASVLGNSGDALKRKKETYKKIGHQQGNNNSQYGSMWITDGTREGNRKINKNDPIPEGYGKGRVCKNKK
jgi:3-oxoacyl-[acyl-carrier-protein] synthase III